MDPLIPSETDILNEIDKFQAHIFTPDNNNNNSNAVIDNESKQTVDQTKSNKKLQNPNETILTQETIKIFSSIHLDKFKTLPFNQQFELLFSDVQFFKTAAVQGSLMNTNLRCISWMILLECIPFDKSLWLDSINQNREIYKEIKYELTINPRDQEMSVDHPLAQDTESNWNQFFVNNELKSLILQDVLRIHKPSQFFHESSTHELIIELLFIYVKHTNSEYRQGMHEILVCIMYVLHEEYTKLAEHDSNEHIKAVANLDYLEHDTFTLFQAVMSTVYEWFNSATKPRRSSSIIEEPKLFQPEEEIENVITSKINYITHVLLRNNDSELYFYFLKNDISLAPFGIRWLRLLFLRELEFPPCLILWDAIFAIDRKNFTLANYIFISLLMSLRERIIFQDHSNCMRLLMQQDLRIDSLNILKRALYLQNPETYSMPDSMMEDSFEYIQPNTNSDHMLNTILANKSSSAIFPSSSVTTPQSAASNNKPMRKKDDTKINKSNSMFYLTPENIPNNNNNNNNNMSNINNTFNNVNKTNKLWQREMNLIALENMFHNKDLVAYQYINKITELQNENELLKIKLSDLEELCQMCSTKMDATISLLQEEILKLGIMNNENVDKTDGDDEKMSKEDAILSALAKLKQIRDQLSFSFIEDDKILELDTLNKKLKSQNNISPTKLKLNFLKHFKFNITSSNNNDGQEKKKHDTDTVGVDADDTAIEMTKPKLVMNTENESS